MGRIALKHLFWRALIVLIGLVLVLVPFSLLVGWNLFTLLLFWFIIVPALTFCLPTLFSKDKNHLFESLTGLLLFYGLMVFMIYEHDQTDYFQVMMASAIFNFLIVMLFGLLAMKYSKD